MFLAMLLSTFALAPKVQRYCQSWGPTPALRCHKAGTPLLKLPLDVLLCITDKLPLHAWVLLSQTCKALRSTLPPRDLRQKLWRLPRSQRMAFYAGLAYVFPDYLACLRCCRLHHVDVRDTPFWPNYTRHDCPHARTCTYHSFHPSPHRYTLTHNHVQLALKYTRQPSPSHAAYLRNVMTPYYTYGQRDDVLIASRGAPKIVEGRFLFERAVTFKLCDGGCIFRSDVVQEHSAFLCRHETVCLIARRWAGVAARSGSTLEEWAERGASLVVACERCRTDIRMVLSEDKLVFRSWQDFGSEEETGYKVMALRYALDEVCYMWRDEDVSHLRQPRDRHVPGSIEEWYGLEPRRPTRLWKRWFIGRHSLRGESECRT